MHLRHRRRRSRNRAPEGDRGRGITNRTSHFSTPEDEASCHYFWLFARNYRLDDDDLDARLHPGVHQTFREDVDAVEAQQRGIDQRPVAVQIDVNADQPTIQARRMLASLIEGNTPSYAASPAE